MNTKTLPHEKITLQSAFGDKKVHVVRCIPNSPNGIGVVLLHGVHSCANLNPTNKFRCLAEILTGRGYTPWLVETSRKTRDRRRYTEYPEWVSASFSGKSYEEEQSDCFSAIEEAAAKSRILWLWGFSLGGIIALSAASRRSDVDTLIVSGTGLYSRPEVEEYMMKLPVLSTMRSVISPEMVSEIATKRFISFRGTNDETFPEESCIDLFHKVPLSQEKKHYYPIEGADHSLRMRYGKNSPEIMAEMVDKIEEALIQ